LPYLLAAIHEGGGLTPIADMIEQMLADNAPAAAIVAAVRAMERVTLRDKEITLRNVTLNRERQKAWRNRQKEQKLMREAQANDGADRNALANVTEANPPCDLSFLSSSIGEPLKKESKREVVARARGTRMEPGAILTDEFRQAAIELGALADEIPNTWAEFVDYWIGVPGSRGLKLDWLATWRNRVRDVLKKGNRNGQRTGNSRTSGSDAILAAATRAARKLAGDSPVAGGGSEAEFSFRDGTDPTPTEGNRGTHCESGAARNGRAPGAGGMFEGEIIPPDKVIDGVSFRRKSV
jgi:hypothetical protein